MLDPDYDDWYSLLPWYSRWWKHGGGWDFRNNLRRAWKYKNPLEFRFVRRMYYRYDLLKKLWRL
jgi:hypothetical protein